MHQDKDEVVNEPVVSLSIGNTCRFRLGNSDHRNKPYGDINLASGDALVFGRETRALKQRLVQAGRAHAALAYDGEVAVWPVRVRRSGGVAEHLPP